MGWAVLVDCLQVEKLAGLSQKAAASPSEMDAADRGPDSEGQLVKPWRRRTPSRWSAVGSKSAAAREENAARLSTMQMLLGPAQLVELGIGN